MAEFKWSIPTTEFKKDSGYVFTAHYRCDASDGDFHASSYGTAGFSQDPEADGFTPYEDLTEAQVLEWVWADGVDKDATEAALAQKIEDQKHPTTAAGVPWDA